MGAFFLLLWNPARNHLYQGPILKMATALAGSQYDVERYEANGYVITPLDTDLKRASGRAAFTKRQSNTYYFLVLLLATIAAGATVPDMLRYWTVYLLMESLSVILLLSGLLLKWSTPLFLMEFNAFYLNRFIVVIWGFVHVYSAVTGQQVFRSISSRTPSQA